jgi:hypothetical protein
MISHRHRAMSDHRYNGRCLRGALLGLALLGTAAACAQQQAPVNPVDISLDPWLGKTKEERVQVAGAPTQCTNLNTGEEVCDWVRRGPYDLSIDCPADGMYGGHRCRRTESAEKHHLIFRYDRKAIARRWTYWGAGGERSSGDGGAIEVSGMKEARISGR